MARVAAARWLVPVVAVATETATTETGDSVLVTDTRSDMAAVTLTAPDGSRALPIFTSLEALARWDADRTTRAGDRGGRGPVGDQRVLRRARRRRRLGARDGPAAEHAVGARAGPGVGSQPRGPARRGRRVRGLSGEEDLVTGHRIEAGEPAGGGVLRVVLTLSAGLDAETVSAVATRVGERLATDGETRARIDSLTFALETAP